MTLFVRRSGVLRLADHRQRLSPRRRWLRDASRSRLYGNGERPMSLDADLALTTSHVVEGRRRVARQRALILKLSNVGCSTLDAERTLETFRSTLTVFEQHEQRLIEKKKRRSSRGGSSYREAATT